MPSFVDPAILFFVFGMLAGLLRSNLGKLCKSPANLC